MPKFEDFSRFAGWTLREIQEEAKRQGVEIPKEFAPSGSWTKKVSVKEKD